MRYSFLKPQEVIASTSFLKKDNVCKSIESQKCWNLRIMWDKARLKLLGILCIPDKMLLSDSGSHFDIWGGAKVS